MKGPDREARHVLVSGRVQGVAFRWCTLEEARRLGLAGWVRNLPDGRVEVRCEGPGEGVEALLRFLEGGPGAARVSALDARPVAPEGGEDFTIR